MCAGQTTPSGHSPRRHPERHAGRRRGHGRLCQLHHQPGWCTLQYRKARATLCNHPAEHNAVQRNQSSQLLLNRTQLCPTCQPPAPSCSSTNIIIMMLHALRFSDPITFCLHARLATLRSHAYRQIACHRGEPPCLLPSVHSGSGTEPTTPRPRRRHRHRRGCRRALHLRFRPGVTSTAFSTLSLS
jgi:hypothetical protein